MAKPIEVVERDVKAVGGPGPVKISSLWHVAPSPTYIPEKDTFFRRSPTIRATRRKLFERLQILDSKLEILFTHPIKFKFVKRPLRPDRLEILYLSLHQGPINLVKLDERQRRQLFKRLIRELKLRQLTYEEVRQLRIALGYPAKKPTKFQRHVREAMKQLIDDLQRDMKKPR